MAVNLMVGEARACKLRLEGSSPRNIQRLAYESWHKYNPTAKNIKIFLTYSINLNAHPMANINLGAPTEKKIYYKVVTHRRLILILRSFVG